MRAVSRWFVGAVCLNRYPGADSLPPNERWSMSEVLERPASRAAEPAARVIDLDADEFRAKFNCQHFVFRHHLSDHPLFSLPRLIELARTTAATRADDLYYDAGVQDIGQRWGTAPAGFPVDETIA